MGIITISRGSYSNGKKIAEMLSKRLGYECISREILLETSAQFNIDEIKLIRAIHDAPSIFDRFKHGKEKYIAFIREAFLAHIRKGNVVYHGLAGPFFCMGIPNILRVRILSSLENRIKEEMQREKISEKEARYVLKKDDEERRKWGMYLHGVDTNDPNLYDIVLHIDNLKVADAVDILADVAQRPCFQTNRASEAILRDHYLAAKAKETLFDRFPSAEVRCRHGIVYVSIETDLSLEQKETDEILRSITDSGIDDIKQVKVNVIPLGAANLFKRKRP
jgi:cytidylate kinase